MNVSEWLYGCMFVLLYVCMVVSVLCGVWCVVCSGLATVDECREGGPLADGCAGGRQCDDRLRPDTRDRLLAASRAGLIQVARADTPEDRLVHAAQTEGLSDTLLLPRFAFPHTSYLIPHTSYLLPTPFQISR